MTYAGRFNISVWSSASWSATVHVQRKFGATGGWNKVTAYTSNAEEVGITEGSSVYFRAGVPTTLYSSGIVNVRLSQG